MKAGRREPHHLATEQMIFLEPELGALCGFEVTWSSTCNLRDWKWTGSYSQLVCSRKKRKLEIGLHMVCPMTCGHGDTIDFAGDCQQVYVS